MIGVGDQAGRHLAAGGARLQQHAQQLDRGLLLGRQARAFAQGGQRLGIALEPAIDGLDDVLGALGAGEALAERPEVGQLSHLGGRAVGDVVEGLVAQDAVARHVLPLGQPLAPGRQLDQHGQPLAVAHAHLEPAPGVLGARLVGFRARQLCHLLVEPAHPAAGLEIALEAVVDVAQVRHVGERVGQLLLRQGPARPIGKARGLVEGVAGDLLDEAHVAHGLAEAAHHGGNLGIEDRMRDEAGLNPDDLQVLARGVEHLDHALVGHQLVERRKVDRRRQRIDDGLLAWRGQLDDAEPRPEGLLAYELGIDGYERMSGEAPAEVAELGGRGDQTHGRARYNRIFPATQSIHRERCQTLWV